MSKNRKKFQPQSCPGEDFRIYLDEIFRDFKSQNDIDSYEFPNNLTSAMRKYIHEKCLVLGLKSKSHGKEPNRIITIYKKHKIANVESFVISLSEETRSTLSLFAHQHPIQNFDAGNKRQKIQNIKDADTFGKLYIGETATVAPATDNPLLQFRKTLPIYPLKNELLDLLANNKVLIVSAETGSGKTTQVPQFILDDACDKNKEVRVICTQPRRLSTIAIAERVAAERGEKIGFTVGYQIKLESRLGPKTSLVYCTNGVLLRTLMNGDDCFNHITHVIVDEIHERDKYSDFLLICLRECIQNYPHLRIILMSATMDMAIYKEYFKNVKVIDIPGRQHHIVEWFLDDILPQLSYENRAMKDIRILREKNSPIMTHSNEMPPILTPFAKVDLDPELDNDMNSAIMNCFNTGAEEDCAQIMQLLLTESASPNFQESDEGYTPLIVAAKHGHLHMIEQLLNLGADPFVSSNNGLTPSGWAQQYQHPDVVNILSMYHGRTTTSMGLSSHEPASVLADYDRSVSEEHVDYDLVIEVIKYIHYNLEKNGGILVFLPGYDDIISCNERIIRSGLPPSEIQVFMLHGSMEMKAQHQVFKKLPPGKQKIILSTNVAETSITIDDVLFVINAGKAKEKSYDPLSGTSSLKTTWISMASARQRAGRAGRVQNGYCFHLFSVNRYESLALSTTPEILRVPLDELCLQTKMLAPDEMTIEAFLNLAIQPPSRVAVNNAINGLTNLGALDKEEKLTPLGHHLVQLSLDPRLGKMLIYSAIFKCLDPVLTIVSCLAHKDPFILPSQSNLKATANEIRKVMSEDSLSDHFTLLRSFQKWQDTKIANCSYRFCDENFISPACMEMIMLTRVQLLSQLRAVGFVLANPKDNINELNQNSDYWPLVKGCLASGIYPNLAYYNGKKLHTKLEKLVHVNVASCLRNSLFDHSKGPSTSQNCWVLYEELNKNGMKCTIRCATAVNPLTIALLCGLEFDAQDDGCIILDSWFDMQFNSIDIKNMRCAIDEIVRKKVLMPRYRLNGRDDEVLKQLTYVLSMEDMYSDMPEIVGVGTRPKLLHFRANGEFNPDKRVNQRQGNQRGNGRNQYNNRDYQQPPAPGPSFYRNNQHYNNNGRPNQRQNAGFYDQRGGNQYSSSTYYNNDNFGYNNDQFRQNKDYFRHNDGQNNAGPPIDIDWVCPYPNLFPEDAVYFIIKPLEEKNITISLHQQTWNFAAQTERKLFRYFMEHRTIILIYTVRGTNKFHGIAKLESTNNGTPNQPCPIEWITSNQLGYHDVRTFIHPRIHLSEDGTILNPSCVGQKLCTHIYEACPRSNRPIVGRHK